jgi:hypothetical protein
MASDMGMDKAADSALRETTTDETGEAIGYEAADPSHCTHWLDDGQHPAFD